MYEDIRIENKQSCYYITQENNSTYYVLASSFPQAIDKLKNIKDIYGNTDTVKKIRKSTFDVVCGCDVTKDNNTLYLHTLYLIDPHVAMYVYGFDIKDIFSYLKEHKVLDVDNISSITRLDDSMLIL